MPNKNIYTFHISQIHFSDGIISDHSVHTTVGLPLKHTHECVH